MSGKWTPRSRQWYSTRPRENPIVTSPPPPVGPLIQTVSVKDLDNEPAAPLNSAKIHNARTVTSFSWVDEADAGPTIMIPGKPPLWTPQANPRPLKEDSGRYFRDKNAARYPKHPVEPAVIASLLAEPELASKLDLFACGSTLGNLLRFVTGPDKSFRMLVYKVQNTVFLVRRENSPTELIPDVRGFGHTFPEANTTWEPDVKGSASHQRLLRYDFGGLDILVRFEADGYFKGPGTESANPPTASSSSTTVQDLLKSFSTVTISPPLTGAPPGTSSPSLPTAPSPTPTITSLRILTPVAHASPHHSSTAAVPSSSPPAPTPTPHAALFDLKTRSIHTRQHPHPDSNPNPKSKDHLALSLPRLWTTQIPTLILAFHTHGHFRRSDTEIHDMRERVRQWEAAHERRELARLARLLRRVRRVVGEVGGPVELCYSPSGSAAGEGGGGGGEGEEGRKLEVREVLADAGEVLSRGVREWWERLGREEGGFDGQGDRAERRECEAGEGRKERDSEGGTDVDAGDGTEEITRSGSDDLDGDGGGSEIRWDGNDDDDFTACSAEACGYCGRCTY